MSKPELTEYLPLANPSKNATHVQVKVYHYKGQVVMTAHPAEVHDTRVIVSMAIVGGGTTYRVLDEMPRLAPKKLQAHIDAVRHEIRSRSGPAWDMVEGVARSNGHEIDRASLAHA